MDSDSDDDFILLWAAARRRKRARHKHKDPFKVEDHQFTELYHFNPEDVKILAEELGLPLCIRTPSGSTCRGSVGLCYLLHRYRTQATYRAAAIHFGVSSGFLATIVKWVEDFLYRKFARKLSKFHRRLVRRGRLDRYARAIHAYGNPFQHVWAFIDGTKFFICKQHSTRELGGKDKRHCLSFQAVVAPDGIIVHLYGGVEGRLNDLNLLADSKLEEEMNARPGTTPLLRT